MTDRTGAPGATPVAGILAGLARKPSEASKAIRQKTSPDLRTDFWQTVYRMGTIEPVFANLRHAKGMNRINYRGRQKVGVIWTLWCIVHNIGKIALYSPEYGVET